ncbi:MAG: MarR family winged helix-turn-helix transcriptional regulator [Rhodanobacteraceae bacterium]
MSAVRNIDSTIPPDAAPRSLHGTHLRRVLLNLIWAQQAVDSSLQGTLAPEQLHLNDWLIVGELAGGTSSLSVLARSLKRDPGSLSRAIDRLVERHLVIRVRIERNRRCMNLALTPEGLSLHRRLLLRIKRLIDALPDPMAQWGLVRLHGSLEDACRTTTRDIRQRHRARH